MKYLSIGMSLTLLLFVTAELSADKLYTWTDEKGNLHITEDPSPQNAKTMDVMTYQPQTEAQIQKNEADQRRQERQYQGDQNNDPRQENEKTNANTEHPADEEEGEVYIGGESKMIRRAEESKEMRDRRQDVWPGYRYHRR